MVRYGGLLKKFRLIGAFVLVVFLLRSVYFARHVVYDLVEHAEMLVYDQDGDEARSRTTGPGVKIFCMILTAPKNFDTKARAANLTWASQCDSYRFMSVIPENSSTLGLPLDQPEGHSRENYDQLTSKVYSSLKHLYRHHRGYDWYLKADDDTYFFLANLRAFLSGKNPRAALFYGHKFQFFLSSYHSGGAGYVISSGAMKQLGHQLSQSDFGDCPNTGVEDQDVAACLRRLNIFPKEANDRATGLPLFNYGRLKPEQWSMTHIKGFSPSTISLHYLTVPQMYDIHSLWKTYKNEMFSPARP